MKVSTYLWIFGLTKYKSIFPIATMCFEYPLDLLFKKYFIFLWFITKDNHSWLKYIGAHGRTQVVSQDGGVKYGPTE